MYFRHARMALDPGWDSGCGLVDLGEGWAPICQALGMAVPDRPFPWVNRRSEWVQ